MNFKSVFPSLPIILFPSATASIIFYFYLSLSFYLSVEMLITFFAGFGFLISLGRLAFLLLYYSLRLTYRTAGYLVCFLREGLPCRPGPSLLGRQTLLECIIFFFSKFSISCNYPTTSCNELTRLNSNEGITHFYLFDFELLKIKDCWFSRCRN